MSLLETILGPIRANLSRTEEQVRDFLGVVEIDTDEAMGVVVMSDHVAAILRVSGTDYAYASPTLRNDIVAGWAELLNSAGVSVQVFLHRREIAWDLPGGFLELMKQQVEADLHSEWQRQRYQRMEESLLRGELPAMALGQYLVLRHAVGDTENKSIGREGSMYLPPTRNARFWERPKTAFGGEDGMTAWRRKRDTAIAGLALVVNRFLRDLVMVPGMSAVPCSGLEVAQLLHVLWRDERAFDEWIADDAALDGIRNGGLELLEPPTPGTERQASALAATPRAE